MGVCTIFDGVFRCTIADLAAASMVQIDLSVLAVAPGDIFNYANASGFAFDPNISNNREDQRQNH